MLHFAALFMLLQHALCSGMLYAAACFMQQHASCCRMF
jgi:hypothetical protein